jgi:hypothetical protein
LDTGHHLGDEDQVNDQWGSEEGVFADIEQTDGLVAAHEDLCVVLVQGTLVVSDSWHVLDDDAVIWVLALLVENVVGSDHIVDNIRLGDLLGAELLLGAQVLAVIVAEMVVAGNGGELDTGVDEKVNESRLHLSLARLEVVTADEGIVLLSQLNGTWNEGVLGRSIDERNLLKNASNSEDGGRRNFLVATLDGSNEIVSTVVDTIDKFRETLGVGSPLNDDLLEVVLSLEVASWFISLMIVLDDLSIHTGCSCESPQHVPSKPSIQE